MSETLARTAQPHVRPHPDLTESIKVHCAQTGMTEPSWVERLIEAELEKKARYSLLGSDGPPSTAEGDLLRPGAELHP